MEFWFFFVAPCREKREPTQHTDFQDYLSESVLSRLTLGFQKGVTVFIVGETVRHGILIFFLSLMSRKTRADPTHRVST